ncbi:MAG: hypothetical protein KIT70_05660 [Anaerolineales bacterium]|nr:MAG: hypothetical protein KIT70_05660 [Anaerolineales bacterium]
MTNEEILSLMNQYVEMKAQAAQHESEKQRLIEDTLPPDVRQRVAEIEAEFAGKSQVAEEALAQLEEKIKAAVVAAQANVAVEGMKASYHSGRVTWDSKGLDEAMASNPQIAEAIGQYKKQGKDYASFTFPKA